MSEIQNYATGIDDPSSRRYETFSYLPPMSDAQIRRQVEYIVAQHWQPAIEHTESERTASSYWYMWKLPMLAKATSIGSWPRRKPATRRIPVTTFA